MSSEEERDGAQKSVSQTFTRRRVVVGSTAAAMAVALAWRSGSFAQEATPVPEGEAGASPEAADYTTLPVVPPEQTQYENDWPAPNGNVSNTRAAKNAAIDSSNVASLEVAWTFPITATSAFGGATCAPIIAGDLVYVQDQLSNVFAINRETGEAAWTKEYNTPTIGPNGVTLGYGKIYGSTGDAAEVFALDAATGEEVWKADLSDNLRVGIDMSPQVYGGLVFISTVPRRIGRIL